MVYEKSIGFCEECDNCSEKSRNQDLRFAIMKVDNLFMPTLTNSYFPYNQSLEDELKRLFTEFAISRESTRPSAEEVMKEFRHNGQDYEYCPELENPESLPMTVRRKKKKFPVECVFCKNNGEESTYYKCHVLRDADGIVRCPVLRAYTCPICGVKGDHAHTIKYCPGNKNDEVVSFNSVKSLRNSTGKRRSK